MPYNIFIIVGTRPQIMKAAALARALDHEPDINYEVIHSGQHYDANMSGDFFEEFQLKKPKYHFHIGSETHNIFIAKFLLEFDPILEQDRPDMVVVVGDTNTTVAAAIASSKRHIPLAHVEAGLREFNRDVPEEINKIVTDAVTTLFFCPTATGINNLVKEGVSKKIYLTGDITLDLLVDDSFVMDKKSTLEQFNLPTDYIFMTCHREVNTNNHDTLSSIVEAINKIDKTIIWPLHPRVRKALIKYDLLTNLGNHIRCIDPTSYKESQSLIKYAYTCITDSGGVIKESYFHSTPAIIIDKQTEWLETIEEGWHQLAGPSSTEILKAYNQIEVPMVNKQSLGDGSAGIRIVRKIIEYLKKEQ